MNEELEIFLEDCDDQLQMMENALVSMEKASATEEDIGAIFRAVHTIKGSAGMFGFDEIVAFTHTGENLFDKIRQGEIEIDKEMVALFLLCKDHVEKLIQAAVDDEPLCDEDRENGEKLTSALNVYIHATTLKKEETLSLVNSVDEKTLSWHISIRFKKDFFTTGMSINAIFNFFEGMGKVLKNQAVTENIPLLDALDPMVPYIGFELLFLGASTREEIIEVFEFIEDDVDLILFLSDEEGAYEGLIQKRDEETLQTLLIETGFTTADSFTPLDISIDVEKIEEVTPLIKKKSSSSLRVDSNKIDKLINYMSEIVIANSKILTLVSSENEEEENSELHEAAHTMKELLEHVRDGIMDIRMVQVGESFNKFNRIVNDTAKKIGKDIEFVISGGDTELDKTVIERISDPLVHMLRNSIDHGIELPQERVALGKSAQGRVDLRAYPDSGSIVIEIEDDGKGLDRDKILEKALANGLVNKNANLSDEDIYKFIFEAGLSTAEKVSDISGRGVGMDVVRRNIEDLRGTIEIASELGKGSKITIRLPLTLAIIDGFLVQVGETKYIIPLENIKECIELTQKEEQNMGDNEFINLRGEMLPLLNVRELLAEKESLTKRKNIVIVYFGKKSVGLLVDELLGEYQTVIKSLGDVFANLVGVSGGSILGSGEIALIFDIPRLIELKSRVEV
jgi:two-component system chemotaxis sensor kinase CheA